MLLKLTYAPKMQCGNSYKGKIVIRLLNVKMKWAESGNSYKGKIVINPRNRDDKR